jgi:hypothetical protein
MKCNANEVGECAAYLIVCEQLANMSAEAVRFLFDFYCF